MQSDCHFQGCNRSMLTHYPNYYFGTFYQKRYLSHISEKKTGKISPFLRIMDRIWNFRNKTYFITWRSWIFCCFTNEFINRLVSPSTIGTFEHAYMGRSGSTCVFIIWTYAFIFLVYVFMLWWQLLMQSDIFRIHITFFLCFNIFC